MPDLQKTSLSGKKMETLIPLRNFLCTTRLVCPVPGGRGTRLAKRRLNDPARIGGAGAPPSQRQDYFRIGLEMDQ
jgi:hypothetical protein